MKQNNTGQMNISEEQLIIAMQKSLNNSEDLISDADLLKQNNRLPRAYTLYQLAIEEAGKALDLLGSIMIDSVNPKMESNFKSHIFKAQRARMISLLYAVELAKKDKLNGERLLEWTLLELKQPELLNDYKNYSLYTSAIDNTYKAPKEIIGIGRVDYIELMAKNRFAGIKFFVTIGLKHLSELKEYSRNNPIDEAQLNASSKEFVENNFPTNILKKVFP